jgi:hypothetical protein
MYDISTLVTHILSDNLLKLAALQQVWNPQDQLLLSPILFVKPNSMR